MCTHVYSPRYSLRWFSELGDGGDISRIADQSAVTQVDQGQRTSKQKQQQKARNRTALGQLDCRNTWKPLEGADLFLHAQLPSAWLWIFGLSSTSKKRRMNQRMNELPIFDHARIHKNVLLSSLLFTAPTDQYGVTWCSFPVKPIHVVMLHDTKTIFLHLFLHTEFVQYDIL